MAAPAVIVFGQPPAAQHGSIWFVHELLDLKVVANCDLRETAAVCMLASRPHLPGLCAALVRGAGMSGM
jgi:hypothetical protein